VRLKGESDLCCDLLLLKCWWSWSRSRYSISKKKNTRA